MVSWEKGLGHELVKDHGSNARHHAVVVNKMGPIMGGVKFFRHFEIESNGD